MSGKNWRKRYFTLVGSVRAGFVFSYFKDDKYLHPDDAKGTITLDMHSSATWAPREKSPYSKGIGVLCVRGVSDQEIFVHGLNEAEHEVWKDKLTKSIEAMHKYQHRVVKLAYDHRQLRRSSLVPGGGGGLGGGEGDLKRQLLLARRAQKKAESKSRELFDQFDARALVVGRMQVEMQGEVCVQLLPLMNMY